jgi:hypothetical protein
MENARAAIESEFREKELKIELEKKNEELKKFQSENAVLTEYREKEAELSFRKQEEEFRMLKKENDYTLERRELENCLLRAQLRTQNIKNAKGEEKSKNRSSEMALEYSRKKRMCEDEKNYSRKRSLLSYRLTADGTVTQELSSSLDEDSTFTSSSSSPSPSCTASHSSSRSLSLSNDEQEKLLVAIANASGCSAEDARVVNGCIILFIRSSGKELQLISVIEVTLKYLCQLRKIEVNERVLVEVLNDPTQILRLFHYLFLSNECDIFYRNSAAVYASENEAPLVNDKIGNPAPSTIVLIVIESAAVESLLTCVRSVTVVSYSCFFLIEKGSTYLLLEFVEDGKLLAYFSSILSLNFAKTCVLIDSAVDANSALFGCLAGVSCACRYADS